MALHQGAKPLSRCLPSISQHVEVSAPRSRQTQPTHPLPAYNTPKEKEKEKKEGKRKRIDEEENEVG